MEQLIVTIARKGLLESEVVTIAEVTGDILAQQRGEASGIFRRTFSDWPDEHIQTADDKPVYQKEYP